MRHYEVTAVIITYNRSGMLTAALESVLKQESRGVCYEVIVVDNNSTDTTREVVEGYIAEGHKNLRYVFEPRQGSSFARNAGLAVACSEIIAFADDDVRVAKDWIATIKRTFDASPEFDCIGGKVLPLWRTPPPNWLTPEHWMPLALQDYGNRPLTINLNNPLCLVSANLAIRREAIVAIGLFAPDLQRIKDGIGSMEDAELLERYWRAGRDCLYVPELIVETDVAAERMTKAYHRRWHTGHGHFYAIMRSIAMERASSRLFDVPAFLYKQATIDAVSWLVLFLLGNPSRSFACEKRLHFFQGFFRTRRLDYLATAHRSVIGEIVTFIRALASKKAYGEIPE
jgi:glycosyltransferase involved in cell wall biosynthesis